MKGTRTNFVLSTELLRRLREAKKKTGLSVSEIVRCAINNYLTSIGM